MKVAYLHFLISKFKVSVLQRHRQEESLVIAPKIGKHLNHPINHASAESRRDLVSTQATRDVIFTLLLQVSQVLVNIVIQFVPHVHILPLNITRLFTRHLTRRMVQ
jgi:hypothetical protein